MGHNNDWIFQSEELRRTKADAEFAERTGINTRKDRKLGTIEVDGVDTSDAPDFADAFISYAEWDDGTELTDEELDELNEDSAFVYDQVIAKLY